MSRSRRGGRRGEAVIGPATGCRDGGNATRGHLGSSRSWSANDGPESIGRIGNPTRRFFHIKGPGNHRASLPRNQRKHVEPGCSVHGPGKWTSFGASSLDQLGSVLFSEHPPLLRQYSLFFLFFYFFFSPHPLSLALSLPYVLHHPRKAADIYSSHVFFMSTALFFFFLFLSPSLSSDEPGDDHRSLRIGLTSCYTHCRTQAYILLLHYSSMRIYVFSLYIYTCIHTITTTSFAYIYIWTHCHTRAHTLLLYVYSYIYTHYTYII